MTPGAEARRAPSRRLDRTAVRTAVALLVGSVTVLLASTVVSVALHDIAADLGIGIADAQWVVTAYLLALCVVVPAVGWLLGRWGAKRVWISALALFLLGSVACALAPDAEVLVASRAVQGLGAGAMMPLLTTILVRVTPEPDRVRVTSVVALATAVGPIAGPVVGGLVLSVADWRWLFWMNLPLCLVAMVLAGWLVPRDVPERRVRLDVVGLALLSPALVGLVWGLSNLAHGGGSGRPAVLGPAVGGAVLLAGFVLWALRRRELALVDLGVLRSRATWAATAMMSLSGAAVQGAMVLLPLYWQQVRGADALAAGLLMIPQGIGALLSRSVAVRLMAHLGGRLVSMVGFALAALATVPFALADASTDTWILLVSLVLRGLGVGMVIVPLMTVGFIGLAHDEVPHASILLRISQQLGGSVGVALLAVVLVSATGPGAAEGFEAAFWCSVGFAGVAVLLSVALPRGRS